MAEVFARLVIYQRSISDTLSKEFLSKCWSFGFSKPYSVFNNITHLNPSVSLQIVAISQGMFSKWSRISNFAFPMQNHSSSLKFLCDGLTPNKHLHGCPLITIYLTIIGITHTIRSIKWIYVWIYRKQSYNLQY